MIKKTGFPICMPLTNPALLIGLVVNALAWEKSARRDSDAAGEPAMRIITPRTRREPCLNNVALWLLN